MLSSSYPGSPKNKCSLNNDENQCVSGVALICLRPRSTVFSLSLAISSHVRTGYKGRSVLIKGRHRGKLLYEREVGELMNGRVCVPKVIAF